MRLSSSLILIIVTGFCPLSFGLRQKKQAFGLRPSPFDCLQSNIHSIRQFDNNTIPNYILTFIIPNQ